MERDGEDGKGDGRETVGGPYWKGGRWHRVGYSNEWDKRIWRERERARNGEIDPVGQLEDVVGATAKRNKGREYSDQVGKNGRVREGREY